MARQDPARWWEARRAQNTKPATYRCPLCGELLPALSDHMLLFPEGDHARRRHAHTACVITARRQGRLPTREEYEQSRPQAAPGGPGGPDAPGDPGRPATARRLWARLRARRSPGRR